MTLLKLAQIIRFKRTKTQQKQKNHIITNAFAIENKFSPEGKLDEAIASTQKA
ncbi:MAG: hypothetical protein MK289_01360 [Trichodesmium sp. ALOHA_ZT_67]|uniref:hypothetical protein n=1 Tax=Trichodesmium erythraeum TaxID=1206 RepID=UPI00003C9B09|nr:hypothetical protein [Trichodesmium erythraeum GBRTRLIN201]MCH2047188.1 hypothetical protein [Trichodesmium sp. ALOHA_ZT_67]MDE5095957.1 hypothetical protein [Trichodesmium sp. St11_bin5]MDT9338241.1 hypothetical protein [Trichodesmium erythraeum 21-75]